MQRQQDVSVQDGPGHALGDAAEVLRWVGAGMVGGDLHEQVDRHAEQELDDQHHQRGQEVDSYQEVDSELLFPVHGGDQSIDPLRSTQ